MRFIGLLVPFLLLAQVPEDDASFRKLLSRNVAEAEQLYRQKEYAKAAALLYQLLKNPGMARMEEERLSVLYDLACNYSLSGEKEKAIDTLREAVAGGYSDSAHMRQDKDFDNIRGETGYKKIYDEVDARSKAQRTFWDSPVLRTKYREDLPEDEKIAGLSRLWSEAKYNFAYFDHLQGLDWDAQYFAYLPKVRATKSTLEYYQILVEFYAQLRDGHTGVYYPREAAEQLGYPPVTTRLVEGRVFIEKVLDAALKDKGVVPGLEIIGIDGMPVKEYGKMRVAPRVSASTTQDLDHRTYEASLLSGLKNVPVELTLRDAAGETVKKTLSRPTDAERSKLPRPPWKRFEFKMLAGGIAYVAVRTFGDDAVVKDFDAAYPEIQKSAGLILDVRENGGGSSGTGYSILSYLTDKPTRGSQWSTRDYRPAYRAWGLPEKWYKQEAGTFGPHDANPYSRPVVVLTGAATFSAAEDFAVAFDEMKRGKIIGEPTGGSTGQPLVFSLPGGGTARVCTKRDRYPDGKEFVGVGVMPNIEVHPTVTDFHAGRDTVLQAALEFLATQRER